MKIIYSFLFLFIINVENEINPLDDCYVDKGIKTAIVIGKRNDNTSFNGKVENGYMKIEFDTLGRPIKVKNTIQGVESQFIYKNNNLNFVVIKNDQSDFYDSKDSFNEEFPKTVDTTKVIKWDDLGRVLEVINSNGNMSITEFKDCNNEIRFDYNKKGDLVNRFEMIKEKGVLIRTIWTSYFPVKSNRITNYYEYKFDKKGHWIKRSYKHQNKNSVIETRKLTYY